MPAIWFDKWGAQVATTIALTVLGALIWQIRLNENLRGQIQALEVTAARAQYREELIYGQLRELERRVNTLEQRKP